MKPPENDKAGPPHLRILLVEDNAADGDLIIRELVRGGYAPVYRRVDTALAMQDALLAGSWDLIIADYTMPTFDGMAALRIFQHSGLDIPFLLVSGSVGEAVVVAAMKAGAHDYIMKSSLRRLAPAVRRELHEAEIRREKRRTDQALREANRRLHALSARMIEIQEQERRQLARELHDEIGQVLTAVKIDLQTLAVRAASGPTTQGLEQSVQLVDTALARVRSLSLDLRPSQLDDLGLQPALRWYLDRQSRGSGIAVELIASLPQERLDSKTETACFRIIQEAVTNVLRHAQAGAVRVGISVRNEILDLLVEDDGNGFDVAAAQARAARGQSLGLLGMEERAELAGGRLEIQSAVGGGTRVMVSIPLPAGSDRSDEDR